MKKYRFRIVTPLEATSKESEALANTSFRATADEVAGVMKANGIKRRHSDGRLFSFGEEGYRTCSEVVACLDVELTLIEALTHPDPEVRAAAKLIKEEEG